MLRTCTKKDATRLAAYAKHIRSTAIAMLRQSQSGHPGGSLSCADYLAYLYGHIISKTGEPVVVSNGHISPGVYGALAGLGIVSAKEVIEQFRTVGSLYEGHVTRHVRGVEYGTGPLGAGVSAAAGMAKAEQLKGKSGHVYALIGDGESQEGQVYEMMNFASAHRLNNLIVFMDYNAVQLTDSLKNIIPLSPKAQWEAAGWLVIEVHGHDILALHKAMKRAHRSRSKPVLLLGKTIMGRGVSFMEKTGKKHEATWHGKAPKPDEADEAIKELALSAKEAALLRELRSTCVWKPAKPNFESPLTPQKIKLPVFKPYAAGQKLACRTAFGETLAAVGKKNKHVVALTADLAGSVKTSYLKEAKPQQHIECGVAEQHMVSAASGMTMRGMIPFTTTFGVFMTSRAKDQARLSDINHANLKMVSTHCGLSVGKDGPTHQAIDDIGSFMGLLGTHILEPADANQAAHLTRFMAAHSGQMYMRMGRHNLPVLTKANGKPFFDENYSYSYGRCDVLRKGTDITLAAAGSLVAEALLAKDILAASGISAEIVMMSSPKKFSAALFSSVKKTGNLVTIEDHNIHSGYGVQVSLALQKKMIIPQRFAIFGVESYQLSGSEQDLYDAAGLSGKKITARVKKIMRK